MEITVNELTKVQRPVITEKPYTIEQCLQDINKVKETVYKTLDQLILELNDLEYITQSIKEKQTVYPD